MKTIIEASEIINKEFAGCFAVVEGRNIEVVVRCKKSERVYISNGEIRYKGNFHTASIAGQIAERLNLIKNF